MSNPWNLRTATVPDALARADVKQHLTLVHSVFKCPPEWRSFCGYAFLGFQTQEQCRVVTCVWCIARVTRRVR